MWSRRRIPVRMIIMTKKRKCRAQAGRTARFFGGRTETGSRKDKDPVLKQPLPDRRIDVGNLNSNRELDTLRIDHVDPL